MDEHKNNAEHAGVGYEKADISIERLLTFGAGVVGLVALGALGAFVAFHFFVAHQSLGPPATPFENVRQLPPEPRLQVHAPLDLAQYRAGQDKTLDSYGWVDAAGGVVRMPIDAAMKLLLQKGLPIRGSSPAKGQTVTPGAPPPPQNRQFAPTPVGGEEGTR